MKIQITALGCLLAINFAAPALSNEFLHAGFRTDGTHNLRAAMLGLTRIQHHHHVHRRFLGCVRSNAECDHLAHENSHLDHYATQHSHECEHHAHGPGHFACYGWND